MDTKKYTATDLERYHSGKMSESEMHAFEKAALQDPFLADALEGYGYTSNSEQDIAELKQRLEKNKNKKRIIFLPGFLRIAAVLVVIAGLGYMAYILNPGKKVNNLALKEKIESSDSSNIKNMVATKQDSNKDVATAPLMSNDKESEIKFDKVESVKPPKTLTSQVASRELKGRVVDDRGNPIEKATITDRGSQLATTDSTGYFKLKTTDSVITATISAPGYPETEKVLSDKKEDVVVMREEPKELKEVTVMRGLAKKDRSENKPAAPVTTQQPSPEPEGGWNNFNEYIKKNSRPVLVNGQRYKGGVVLSFEVDTNGRPVNIKVDRSLCNDCDAEAVRLLKEGPRWKNVTRRQSLMITL